MCVSVHVCVYHSFYLGTPKKIIKLKRENYTMVKGVLIGVVPSTCIRTVKDSWAACLLLSSRHSLGLTQVT